MSNEPLQVEIYHRPEQHILRVKNLPFNPQVTPKPAGLIEELDTVAPLLAAMLKQHFADARICEFSESSIDVRLSGNTLAKTSVETHSPFQKISHLIMKDSMTPWLGVGLLKTEYLSGSPGGLALNK